MERQKQADCKKCILLIDKLKKEHHLSFEEWYQVIDGCCQETLEYVSKLARKQTQKVYGNRIFIRGLIEISNYCKNNCYYCGIRCGNSNAQRFRLGKDEILECCETGYALGFRTFVLQGGEDPVQDDDFIIDVVRSIRMKYPDCAITLSIGEKEKESYEAFFKAGANRYLLRHETADEEHYSKLHPKNMSMQHRMDCLRKLKQIGYQTGAGMMIGSPGQTTKHLCKDMMFLEELQPEMVGMGPFIPHKDTRFADEGHGSVDMTIYLLALTRLLLPNALIPATTALATVSEDGRMRGINAGANVVMPNLSPLNTREKYNLYDNKAITGGESAERIALLKQELQKNGYEVVIDRGDYRREI